MTTRGRTAILLFLAGLVAATAVAEPDWYYQHPDSMPRIGTNKLFYLEQKYGLCPTPSDEPESLNVRMVGKWGGGPSWGVTGKDTLVYLSRGSEVVVINFADTANPQILNHIQAKRLCARPVLQDTLLYLATSGYIEVFNVRDPVHAERVGRLATPVADIDVEDTLVYTISADSFKVYSFADPGSPYLVGACRDSGHALDIDNGYAYLCDRWGMYVLDATDPASPYRLTSWGTDIAGVRVRGNHCYVAQGQMGTNSLHVLNVSDPAAPWEEGRLTGLTGEDIHLVDTLLFMPGFDVVNIADSSQPTLVGQEPAGGYEVWVDDSLGYAVTAGWVWGLRLLNLADLSNPVLADTTLLSAGFAEDIDVAGGLACVGGSGQGYGAMSLFDVSDPAAIRLLGRYDSAGIGYSAAVLNAESLAYMGAFLSDPREVFHVVDIADPANPVKLGAGIGFNPVKAMALRDSLLYCAEGHKFEVFSVANPRQPVWMGRCDAYSSALGIDVQDTLVYVAPHLQIFNVADPANPLRIYETSGSRVNGRGIAARDTFLYFLSNYDTLWVYSAANPVSPRIIGSLPSGSHRGFDLVLQDSYAYAGCQSFRLFDVTSPVEPVSIGHYETPYYAMDLDLDSQYVYVACYLAGVEILEVLPVGVAEPADSKRLSAWCGLRLLPNPVRGSATLSWSGGSGPAEINVRDAAGPDGAEVDSAARDGREADGAGSEDPQVRGLLRGRRHGQENCEPEAREAIGGRKLRGHRGRPRVLAGTRLRCVREQLRPPVLEHFIIPAGHAAGERRVGGAFDQRVGALVPLF
jgi:hypothetical protein